MAHVDEDVVSFADGDQIVMAPIVLEAFAVACLLVILLLTEILTIKLVSALIRVHVVVAGEDAVGDVTKQVLSRPGHLPVLLVVVHMDQVARMDHVNEVHLVRLVPQKTGHGGIDVGRKAVFRIVGVMLGVGHPGHGLHSISRNVPFHRFRRVRRLDCGFGGRRLGRLRRGRLRDGGNEQGLIRRRRLRRFLNRGRRRQWDDLHLYVRRCVRIFLCALTAEEDQ